MYMVYIRRLPINDTPEIFSLHENANITFAQNETFSLLNGILKLQPKSAAGAGRSREEVSIYKLVSYTLLPGWALKYTYLTEPTTKLVILIHCCNESKLTSCRNPQKRCKNCNR